MQRLRAIVHQAIGVRSLGMLYNSRVRFSRFLAVGVLLTMGLGDPCGADDSNVSALGRLEPGEGVVDVGAAGDLVYELLVSEGQWVERGEIVAYLDTYAERKAETAVRQAQLEEAILRLKRAEELGPLEVRAQHASVRRLEASLKLAESKLERTRSLIDDQVVTEQDHDDAQAFADEAREELNNARTLLLRAKADELLLVEEAQARLLTARRELAAAQARRDRAVIHAPLDGRVLKILAWPGERAGEGPILQIGDTENMYAVAEVYETDVQRVSVGQLARVTSPALPEDLTGKVERIGSMIYKNDVLGVDPTADTDARVVEVRVALDSALPAGRFVHLQVDVVILTTP